MNKSGEYSPKISEWAVPESLLKAGVKHCSYKKKLPVKVTSRK